MGKLLAIAVPTYNRARHLDLLLSTLAVELAGLEDRVEVIVSDNASSDDTPAVTARFAQACRAATVLRQPVNVGPENNFCECIERSEARWCWVIGDDDVPRTGAIRLLLRLLEDTAPDLIYLEARWLPQIDGPSQIGALTSLRHERLAREAFARRVHIHFTFISGVIFDLAAFRARHGAAMLRHHVGTSLVQLGWVLSLLASGERFIHVRDECMLATEGNTGGYAACTVFGANFPRIVGERLGAGSAIARSVVTRHLACYLPSLMWHVRFSKASRLAGDDAWGLMREQIGHHPLYWLYVVPVGRLPKPLAWVFYAVSRVLARLVTRIDLRIGAGTVASLSATSP